MSEKQAKHAAAEAEAGKALAAFALTDELAQFVESVNAYLDNHDDENIRIRAANAKRIIDELNAYIAHRVEEVAS